MFPRGTEENVRTSQVSVLRRGLKQVRACETRDFAGPSEFPFRIRLHGVSVVSRVRSLGPVLLCTYYYFLSSSSSSPSSPSSSSSSSSFHSVRKRRSWTEKIACYGFYVVSRDSSGETACPALARTRHKCVFRVHGGGRRTIWARRRASRRIVIPGARARAPRYANGKSYAVCKRARVRVT